MKTHNGEHCTADSLAALFAGVSEVDRSSADKSIADTWKAWRERCTVPMSTPPESSVVTGNDAAALYDESSGVKGWKAKTDGKRIIMTPPPGYVICYDAEGLPHLARVQSIGVSARKVAE